jgi:hypothetical protein
MATSPPPGAEDATSKMSKDRSCPFCGQAFTSSSLGRHLDLYVKSKNPKPPDGIHDVDEIRKMRGNITRRQSRVASIKRDSSTPAGPASARYTFDDKGAPTPDSPRRVGWSVNRPGWEATGVMNDLPPRIEPRPADRRDSNKRDQLKADLEQRQRFADELDTGRAAQLALKEILDTVRNAEYVHKRYKSFALANMNTELLLPDVISFTSSTSSSRASQTSVYAYSHPRLLSTPRSQLAQATLGHRIYHGISSGMHCHGWLKSVDRCYGGGLAIALLHSRTQPLIISI